MVNFLLCFSSWSGQLSTIPVTKASTLQNSLSMPIICNESHDNQAVKSDMSDLNCENMTKY